ncbi:MAG: gamma-glutamylcyclotransferase [Phycisphaerales bacterium]|nr:gamma-glutamylcyclotransferase [Phycisphaerales bacterium]
MDGFGCGGLAVRADGDTDPTAEAVVWRVTAAGLETLDMYEGVGAGHYRRETWAVRTRAGETVEAAVYLAEPEFIEDGLLPARRYVEHLLAGAEQFLSEAYRAWLRTVRREEVGS